LSIVYRWKLDSFGSG